MADTLFFGGIAAALIALNGCDFATGLAVIGACAVCKVLYTVSPLQKRRADAFGNGHSARLKVRRCIVAWLEERFSASVCPRGG